MNKQITLFLAETCVLGGKASARINKHELYDIYLGWAESRSQPTVTRNRFSRELYKFPDIKTTSCLRYYQNIRLAMPEEMQPDEQIYRDLLTRKAPGLLHVLDSWVADKSGPPLILRLMEATLAKAERLLA
jgi:hypothetical protein